jgi:hypothetical protein
LNATKDMSFKDIKKRYIWNTCVGL